MWRHMALTSAAVLTQNTRYIDAGGGRGTYYSQTQDEILFRKHEMVL